MRRNERISTRPVKVWIGDMLTAYSNPSLVANPWIDSNLIVIEKARKPKSKRVGR